MVNVCSADSVVSGNTPITGVNSGRAETYYQDYKDRPTEVLQRDLSRLSQAYCSKPNIDRAIGKLLRFRMIDRSDSTNLTVLIDANGSFVGIRDNASMYYREGDISSAEREENLSMQRTPQGLTEVSLKELPERITALKRVLAERRPQTSQQTTNAANRDVFVRPKPPQAPREIETAVVSDYFAYNPTSRAVARIDAETN